MNDKNHRYVLRSNPSNSFSPGNAPPEAKLEDRSKLEIEYQNPWFRVIRSGKWYWVEEPKAKNAAVVVPLLPDNRIALVSLYRTAQAAHCLEFPRGCAEAGEDAKTCALRELQEETGLTAHIEHCTVLGTIRPNSALLSSEVSVVRVSVKSIDEMRPDGIETDHVLAVTREDLELKILSGAINDGFTLSAYTLLLISEKHLSLATELPIP